MINRPTAAQVLAFNTEALIFSLFPETDSPTEQELEAKANNSELISEWLKQHRIQYLSWRARNDAGFTLVTLAVLVQDIETLRWVQQHDAAFFQQALEKRTEANHLAPLRKNFTERMVYTEWTPICFALAYNLPKAIGVLLQMGAKYTWQFQKRLTLLTLSACQFNPGQKEPLALQALIEHDPGFCRQMIHQNISFPRAIERFEGDPEVVDNALQVAILHDASLVVRQFLTLDNTYKVDEMVCVAAQSGALDTLKLIKALFPIEFKASMEKSPALIHGIRYEQVVQFLLENNAADKYEASEYIEHGVSGKVLALLLSRFPLDDCDLNELMLEEINERRNTADIIAAIVCSGVNLRKLRLPPLNWNVLHLASDAYEEGENAGYHNSKYHNKYIIAKLEVIWRALGPIAFVDMMQEMNFIGDTPFVRAIGVKSPYVVAWMIAQKCFTFSSRELYAVNAYFLFDVFNKQFANPFDEIYTKKIRWIKLLTSYLCEFEKPYVGGEIDVLPPLVVRYRRLARTYYLLCYGNANQVFNLSLLAAQNIMSFLFVAELFREPMKGNLISKVIFSAEDVNDLIQFMANQTFPLWLRYVAYVCKVNPDGANTFAEIESKLKGKSLVPTVSDNISSLFGRSQVAIDQPAKARRVHYELPSTSSIGVKLR